MSVLAFRVVMLYGRVGRQKMEAACTSRTLKVYPPTLRHNPEHRHRQDNTTNRQLLLVVDCIVRYILTPTPSLNNLRIN
jgi:hypothetical protein